MEIKDLLSAIKYPLNEDTKIEEISVDDIKTHMSKSYIGLEIAHEVPEVIKKVQGKDRSVNEVVLKRVLKSIEVDFEPTEWKDGALEKAGEAIKIKMDKLKEDATKDGDKKYNELLTEHDKLKTDYQTSLVNVENITKEKEEAVKKHESYVTNQSLNQKINEAKAQIEFGENVSKLEIKGFWSDVSDKYDIELSNEEDSGDGLRIITKEDKKRVNDGKENLTLKAILENEAKTNKILKVSNAKPGEERKTTKPVNTEDFTKKVFQGAIDHAENMK